MMIFPENRGFIEQIFLCLDHICEQRGPFSSGIAVARDYPGSQARDSSYTTRQTKLLLLLLLLLGVQAPGSLTIGMFTAEWLNRVGPIRAR